MATLESAITVFAPQRFSNNYRFHAKSPNSVKLQTTSISSSISSHSHNKLHLSSFRTLTPCFAIQEVTEATTEDEKTEETEAVDNLKKKVAVFNLPWSLSEPDIVEVFKECGTVTHVEIVTRKKDGVGRGFVFITMDSEEGAQVAVEQFHNSEVSGRIIRVEFAKRDKRPPGSSDARYGIYVSNLAWKARYKHLRDIFAENFKKPVSVKVFLEPGRSAGYGFVSYHTEEEAQAAISALEGKELMGRPLRVKMSEKTLKEASNEEVKNKMLMLN